MGVGSAATVSGVSATRAGLVIPPAQLTRPDLIIHCAAVREGPVSGDKQGVRPQHPGRPFMAG